MLQLLNVTRLMFGLSVLTEIVRSLGGGSLSAGKLMKEPQQSQFLSMYISSYRISVALFALTLFIVLVSHAAAIIRASRQVLPVHVDTQKSATLKNESIVKDFLRKSSTVVMEGISKAERRISSIMGNDERDDAVDLVGGMNRGLLL